MNPTRIRADYESALFQLDVGHECRPPKSLQGHQIGYTFDRPELRAVDFTAAKLRSDGIC